MKEEIQVSSFYLTLPLNKRDMATATIFNLTPTKVSSKPHYQGGYVSSFTSDLPHAITSNDAYSFQSLYGENIFLSSTLNDSNTQITVSFITETLVGNIAPGFIIGKIVLFE